MKTLESILKTISVDSNRCKNCNVKEGEEHPIQGLKIVLRELPNQSKAERYCQICFIQKSKITQKEKRKEMLLLIKKIGFALILVTITLICYTMPVTAQPGLPGDPAQAPIDGGLGLLAIAGGTYAYKKLRAKE